MLGSLARLAIVLLCLVALGCCGRVASTESADRSVASGSSNPDDAFGERNSSGLIDPLDGVWVYPVEQPGETTLMVVRGMTYKHYRYSAQRMDAKADLEREGPVWGQEGVYFFPNQASYYSPSLFLEEQRAEVPPPEPARLRKVRQARHRADSTTDSSRQYIGFRDAAEATFHRATWSPV
jgi:hypothetical protein